MPAPDETLPRDRKKLSSDCSRLVVLEGQRSLSDRSMSDMDPSSFAKRIDVLAVRYDCSRIRRTARHREVHSIATFHRKFARFDTTALEKNGGERRRSGCGRELPAALFILVAFA